MTKKRNLIYNYIIFSLLVLFVLGYIIYLIIPKSCNDQSCFEEALLDCKKVKYIKNENTNQYYYKIVKDNKNSCLMDIGILKLADSTSLELKSFFEGKNMRCEFPKDKLTIEFLQLGNTLDYCSGPLKEAMFELIIQRMYDLSTKQIGDVVFEIEKTLQEK